MGTMSMVADLGWGFDAILIQPLCDCAEEIVSDSRTGRSLVSPAGRAR